MKKYTVNILPNHEDLDSQIKIDFQAFTDEEAENKALILAVEALPPQHTASCILVLDDGVHGYRPVAEFEAN